LSVEEQEDEGNDDKSQLIGNRAEHNENGQRKEDEIYRKLAPRHMGLATRVRHGSFRQNEAAGCDKRNRKKEGRQHCEHELAVRDAEIRVEIQVLGVTERGEHSAQVCGDVLQDEHKCHVAFVACAVQNDVAEGEECDQRHVVGNEHRTDECYINKGNSRKTEIFRKADDLFSAHIEEIDAFERADDRECAE